MARITTRIKFPTGSPDQILQLMTAVQEKHAEEGVNSPLTGVDMEAFGTAITSAKQKRAEAAKLEAKAQALYAEAHTMMGIAKGQTSKTEGTLYYNLCKIRDLLLIIHRNNENNLEPWGFKVVIGQAAPRQRKDKAAEKPAALDS